MERGGRVEAEGGGLTEENACQLQLRLLFVSVSVSVARRA